MSDNKENIDNLSGVDVAEDLLKRLIFLRDSGVDYLPLSGDLMAEENFKQNKTVKELDEKNCDRCELSSSRSNVVVGEGGASAKLMIVGNFPNRVDDKLGKPFKGTESDLLNKIIKAIGLAESDVFLCYGVRCFSEIEVNAEHIAHCSVHLNNDYLKVKPKAILAFGTVAGTTLDLVTSKAVFKVPGLTEMLEDESLKLETWDAVKKIMQIMK